MSFRRQASDSLLSDVQPLDEIGVALGVFALEVIEQPSSLSYQLQQPPAGMVILCVDLEMLGEVVDALAEERDLNLRRARVTVVCLVRPDNAALPVTAQRHWWLLHERLRRDVRVTGPVIHQTAVWFRVLLLP